MVRSIVRTALLVAAAAATAGTAGTAIGEDPRISELTRLDASLDQAGLRGDRAMLAAAFAEGMIAVDSSGQVTPGEEILGQVSADPEAMHTTVSASEVRVSLFGETAVVTSKKTRSWVINGAPGSADYRETNTYVRREGRWLLVASQTSEPPRPYVARDVAFEIPFDRTRVLGDGDASVVIVEFADYECPHCRRFAAETFRQIEKDYVRPGRAALLLSDYPQDMHPRAFGAAEAARCAAAAGRFRQMHERLLREPVALESEDLTRHAAAIGLDPAAFGRCLADPATAEAIRAVLKKGQDNGLRGTPIFVIGVRRRGESAVHALRMIEGAYPYEVFKATLDSVIRGLDAGRGR